MYARQPEREYDYYAERPGDLRRLDELDDWQVAQGQPDIRSWKVVDMQDNDVGTVDSLLVSTQAEEVIFAVISHGGLLGVGGDRKLVPLTELDIDSGNERVVFMGRAEDIENSPNYSEDTMSFNPFYDYWSSRTGAMRQTMETRPAAETRTAETRVIPEVEERLEVGKRAEQVGEVRVSKEVETHPETVREQVRRIRIHVTRREVEHGREPRAGERVLREGESISIPVIEEKLVAETKPEVTGEVVVTPETVTEEEEVTRQVRSERVHVEETGDVDVEEEEEARTR